MKVTSIQSITSSNIICGEKSKKKKEFIDVIADNIRNPRDVDDCVVVPRGIFKAYIYLMAGSGLISISNFLPTKWQSIRTSLNVLGAALGIISAVYFAKPFAIKGLSPTVPYKNTKK